MNNIYWLLSGKLGGRRGPDQCPWDLGQFRQEGINSIISLSERMLNRSHEIVQFGIKHVCVPLPRNAPPLAGDADDIFLVLPMIGALVTDLLQEGKVLIHCSSGKDRTPLMLSYFLMKHQGLSPKQAMNQLIDTAPNAFTADGWHDMAFSILSRYMKNKTG